MSLKKIDWYIIRKFLGTFFFAILLIMAIAVVLDYNEKMDNFAEHEAPTFAIFKYYCTFVPYMANMLSPLVIFVACIFFTSKLAGNSEIIAMLATGISFNRLLRPYMLSALFLGLLTFALNSWVIPITSVPRLALLKQYYKDKDKKTQYNNQFMVAPGEVAFFYSFDRDSQTGYRFALEKFEGTQLVSRLTADRASWEGNDTWHLTNYKIRDITERGETITEGYAVDTVVHVAPEDIIVGSKDMEKLTTPALKEYIDKQRGRGVGNIKEYEIEYHKRFAAIATSFILTFLGVCLSSKKIRGGMGINLGIGLVLAFAYILFQTVSSSFAVSGAMSVILAVWLPNLVYLPLCWYVYEKKAPK